MHAHEPMSAHLCVLGEEREECTGVDYVISTEEEAHPRPEWEQGT